MAGERKRLPAKVRSDRAKSRTITALEHQVAQAEFIKWPALRDSFQRDLDLVRQGKPPAFPPRG